MKMASSGGCTHCCKVVRLELSILPGSLENHLGCEICFHFLLLESKLGTLGHLIHLLGLKGTHLALLQLLNSNFIHFLVSLNLLKEFLDCVNHRVHLFCHERFWSFDNGSPLLLHRLLEANISDVLAKLLLECCKRDTSFRNCVEHLDLWGALISVRGSLFGQHPTGGIELLVGDHFRCCQAPDHAGDGFVVKTKGPRELH
mmetsp:Transcript_10071/g.11768  ORF Transcript_10071/g.11768 Transcript_10071/m.11768 type:complete len:201 (+) Transcript_10071:1229-1831(+)